MKNKSPVDILIVEDSQADQEMFSWMFESCPIPTRIHFASDGQQGSDYVFRRGAFSDRPTPALIIMDLSLPIKTGRELLEEVRADKKLCPIPIVIVSTSSSSDEVKACYCAGANAFVKKSIDFDEFEKTIKRLTEFWFDCVLLPTRS